MQQTTNVNHHSAAIFPFYKGGNLELLVEIKDRELIPPYFDSGANGLGGNNIKEDQSPVAVLEREIPEEFWIIDEPPGETYNTILGQDVAESRL